MNQERESQQKKNIEKQEEKKRKEKLQFLMKMERDIKKMEFELKHQNIANAKRKTIKNLKISARALQLVAPYVLTAGLVFGGLAHFLYMPFSGEIEKEIFAHIITEMDTLGNIRYEKKYSDFAGNNILYYYTKWSQNPDGTYSRMMKTYPLKKKTYEEIVELLKKENLNFEEAIGESEPDVVIETKNALTEEEQKTEEFIKAVIYYSVDKNDYVVRKMTFGENVIVMVIYAESVVGSQVLMKIIRKKYSSFNFVECVDHIREQNPLIDNESVTKKLELKRENYNRMIR